jgi:hypothetical protein
VQDISKIVAECFSRQRSIQEITMAKVELNNGQIMYGVNDLFIGPKSHISARYKIQVGDKSEQHSSSGIIVSTGLGATGWLQSILAEVHGITRAFGKPMEPDLPESFKWNSDYLYYTVREPFPSKSSQAQLVFGQISKDHPMSLLSHMPENGVIFSDGIESDFLEFNSGTQAVITTAEKKGYLVV